MAKKSKGTKGMHCIRYKRTKGGKRCAKFGGRGKR
jgi:hypothetical protein